MSFAIIKYYPKNQLFYDNYHIFAILNLSTLLDLQLNTQCNLEGAPIMISLEILLIVTVLSVLKSSPKR